MCLLTACWRRAYTGAGWCGYLTCPLFFPTCGTAGSGTPETQPLCLLCFGKSQPGSGVTVHLSHFPSCFSVPSNGILLGPVFFRLFRGRGRWHSVRGFSPGPVKGRGTRVFLGLGLPLPPWQWGCDKAGPVPASSGLYSGRMWVQTNLLPPSPPAAAVGRLPVGGRCPTDPPLSELSGLFVGSGRKITKSNQAP